MAARESLAIAPASPAWDWRWTVALLLTSAVALWAAFVLLRALPGRTVVLATGPEGNAFAIVAERYRASLARHGVTLQLLPTAGAVDNLARLKDPTSHVDAGFVQAGITTSDESPGIESLGTVFYEPLWFFCRCTPRGLGVQDLTGRRLSIGPEGSGTRALALKLLALNKVESSTLELHAYPPAEAASRLERGELDGALMLSGWESVIVQRLLANPDIGLIGFSRADAYLALLPFLNKVRVPMGVGNLAANRPPLDTVLLAPEASIAVRASLHPALQYLLLEAANEAHSGPGVFQRSGEFPAAHTLDLPLSREARQYYKSGPSALQRYLPFWLAPLVQRLLFIALPLAGIIYPIWSMLPQALQWRAQRRLYLIYGELTYLETELRRTPPAQHPALLERLTVLDKRVGAQPFPRGLTEMSYNLRVHIDLVRQLYCASHQ
jgi:TRAP-type uncharacterized transport system substrate-binding protein